MTSHGAPDRRAGSARVREDREVAAAPVEAAGSPTRADWSEVLFASVWLVFLVFPVVSVLNTPASPGARALGLTGLGLFAVLYVVSWLRETLLPGRGPVVNCVVWCLILLVPLGLSLPVDTLATTFTAPFFLAVCIFRLPLRNALLAAVVVAAVAVTPWLFLAPVGDWVILLTSLTPAWLILLVSRLVMERSTINEELKRELHLAGQREAVGRDVHDILGHSLTVISVKVQLAQRLLDTDPQRAHRELDDVLALSRESLTDVRATVGRLRQPELSVQVVQARTALRSAGVMAHVSSAIPPVPQQWGVAFAWILREAVTNVVRHSGAQACWITVTSRSLTITDDGAGLGAARDGGPAAAWDGNGLQGMRERAEKAGLRLRVFSPVEGKSHGTRIVVEPR